MKKLVKTILLLFISVSLLSCSKSEKLFPENRENLTYDSSKSNMTNKVNLDIFSTLVKNNKTDENFVLSPLSIQRCLDLISLCTEDRKDLDFLKMYDDAHLQNLNFKNTSLASLILINLQNVEGKTKNLNYGNIKTVKSSKEATKAYRDFQKSNLKEILDKDELGSDLVAAFIDTVNYEVKWEKPFIEKKTEKRDFTKLDGSKIQVNTMYNVYDNKSAISDDEKEVFSISSNESTIYFIKPKKNKYYSSNELLGFMKEIDESNERYTVNFFLPKIDTKSDVDFKDLFEKIGLGKMLNSFKLERLLPDMSLKVSDAKQNSTLKIDEKGAKAKSVTKIGMKSTSAPSKGDKIDIKMDSSFYVIITDYDENSKANLITFTAFITDPSR